MSIVDLRAWYVHNHILSYITRYVYICIYMSIVDCPHRLNAWHIHIHMLYTYSYIVIYPRMCVQFKSKCVYNSKVNVCTCTEVHVNINENLCIKLWSNPCLWSFDHRHVYAKYLWSNHRHEAIIIDMFIHKSTCKHK